MTQEFVLKLQGKASLPKALDSSKTYHVSLEGDIGSVTTENNHDGTETIYYKFLPHHIELLNEKGQVMEAKDKSRMSQQLRRRLFVKFGEAQTDLDFDEFYQQEMSKIIQNV